MQVSLSVIQINFQPNASQESKWDSQLKILKYRDKWEKSVASIPE